MTDDTGGLRRSGLVRVAWPAVWNRVGGDRCRLRATVVAGGYTEPVRVLSGARQRRRRPPPGPARRRRHRPAGRAAAATRPDRFASPAPPARSSTAGSSRAPASPSADGARARVDVGGELGRRRRRTTASSSSTASAASCVFGDGRAGARASRRPRTRPSRRVRARSAASAGNLGSSGAWAQEGGAVVGTNPVPATGGRRRRRRSTRARQRAADELARPDRTVTDADAADACDLRPRASASPRAHASPGHHPGFPASTCPAR